MPLQFLLPETGRPTVSVVAAIDELAFVRSGWTTLNVMSMVMRPAGDLSTPSGRQAGKLAEHELRGRQVDMPRQRQGNGHDDAMVVPVAGTLMVALPRSGRRHKRQACDRHPCRHGHDVRPDLVCHFPPPFGRRSAPRNFGQSKRRA